MDGRAAWREIKSDCLGKSEPPLPSKPHHPVVPESGHLLSGCRAAYQPRNEEHEEHTYRGISGPLSSPRLSFPRVRLDPSEGGGGGERRNETVSQVFCRTAINRRNASSGRGNKLSSNTSGIFPCPFFSPAANSKDYGKSLFPRQFRGNGGPERSNFEGGILVISFRFY